MIDWDVDPWMVGRGYRDEKRHSARVFMRGMKARCELGTSSGLYDVEDISSHGARLRLGLRVPLNAPVLVEIMVPGQGAFRTRAVVVWRKRDLTVGLWFDDLDPDDRRMIESVVEAYLDGRHNVRSIDLA